jgi:YkoY family integral membrane protein
MIPFSAVAVIVQLIFLECILSIDNAAVLGAMVAYLPIDKPTPWPRRLHPLLSKLNPMLGPQRDAALKVGLFGAYAGRAVMLVLASAIMEMPWVQILGAAYLLYLGISHFAGRYQSQQDEEEALVRRRAQFWSIVVALNLADMAFSVDNVVAAVTLSQELWIVLIGVGIGILAMRFAASLFSRLIQWEPELESGAYLLLLFIGGKFLMESWFNFHIDDFVQFGISIAILALTIAFARMRPLRPLLALFRPILKLFALIQAAVALIIRGLTAPVRMLRPHKEEEPERIGESEPGIY